MIAAMADESLQRSPRFIGVLFVLLVIFLSLGLSHREFHGEEGRRAMAAREMIASGDFLVPTVSGIPYLNKPPLYPWLTAVVASIRGEVDAVTVRIPAMFATTLTAMALLCAGFRLAAPRVGVLAAFLFLLCPMVMRKSTLGETDLLLTLGCSLYALEMLVACTTPKLRVSPASVVSMILGLCMAFLSKGTAALPFVVGVLIAAIWMGEAGSWKRPRWWAPPLLSAALSSLWFVAVLQRPEALSAYEGWFNEMARVGSSPKWWQHRWEYISGVLLGFFPATLVLLMIRQGEEKKRFFSDSIFRFLVVAVLVPAICYLLWPGVQPRYLLPAVPLICLLAARWIDLQAFAHQELQPVSDRVMETITRVLQGLLVAVAFVALVIAISRSFDPQMWPKIPTATSGSWIAIAAILLVGALIPTRSVTVGFPGPSWTRLLLLLVAWLMIHSLVLLPIRGQQRPGERIAHSIEEAVPEDRSLWHDVSANWNTLAQVDRDLIQISTDQQPSAGDWVLIMNPGPGELVTVMAVVELKDGSRRTLGVLSSGPAEGK